MNDSTDGLIRKAYKDVQTGRYAEAEAAIRAILDKEPRNAWAFNIASRLECRRGNFDAAVNYALKACQEQPTADHVVVLAMAFAWKQDYAAARNNYRVVLEKFPQHYECLIGLAELYALTGYQSLAIRYFDQALAQDRFHPIALFLEYAKLFPCERAPDLLATFMKLLPQATAASPEEHLRYQMEYVVRKEDAARAERGIGCLARGADDLFFCFAQQERDAFEAIVDTMLAKHPDLALVYEAKIFCLVSRGQRKEAIGSIRALAEAEPRGMWPCVIFDDGFYQSLEKQDDAALFGALPDMIDVTCQAFAEVPIMFLSCDYRFFTHFARAFLASINAVHPRAQVHVHVMDAPDDKIAEIAAFCAGLTSLTVAVSIERTPMPAPVYYHAIRFIRQYQLLKRYGKPVWVLDVDALLNRDLKQVMEATAAVDIAGTAHAGSWHPWIQFRAGFVAVNATDRGFAFSRLVAAYIADCHAKDKLRWGIDQMALYGVYAFLKEQGRAPALRFFDERVLDTEYRDDGILWIDGGKKKFMQISALDGEDGSPDLPLVRYRQAAAKYAK